MNKKTAVTCLLLLTFLVAFHQFSSWGVLFEVADLHHETLIVALLSLVAGILLSKKLEE